MSDSLSRPDDRGFPLSTLFLLIAACGVVLGMIAPLARGRLGYGVGGQELVLASIGGSVLLMVTGAIVGSFQQSRLRGVAWGVLAGGLLGLAFGPAIFIPPRDFPIVMLTAVGGAVIILVVAAVIRCNSAAGKTTKPRLIVEADVVEPKRHPLDPDPEDDAVVD